MISVTDVVFIHPAYSMAFGGKWGVVMSIDDGGLYWVCFNGDKFPYFFTRNELVSMDEYNEANGDFQDIEIPLPEEE